MVPIHVPPLRERAGDAALLARHYLEHFCRTMGQAARVLDEAAVQQLAEYAWPGNVRELRNLMERLVILTDAAKLGSTDLAPLLSDATEPADMIDGTLADQLEAYERRVISRVLDSNEGNVAAAARELGLDRANLHRKLKRLSLAE